MVSNIYYRLCVKTNRVFRPNHYRVLFEASHAPHQDSNEALQSLFNIHSGGSPSSLSKQIQTFKALSEYSDFRNGAGANGAPGVDPLPPQKDPRNNGEIKMPPVQIDLHIHLPENKTTRDYEAIIQDIARYIYGRKEVDSEAK